MSLFALADCNNFYASCERVFNPKLEGQPIVVLSNNDGCLIARSNEAKALGIPMAVPFYQVKDFCQRHGVKVFSSNYTLYGDMSRRVMDILGQHCPDIEIYSIDEAFLRLDRMAEDPEILCQRLRDQVLRSTGIPMSIGIGTTKTLAKLANHVAKRVSQTPVYRIHCQDQEAQLFARLPVGVVWGIGRRWAKRLEVGLNITNVEQLHRADPKLVRSHLSVMGERVVRELNGESCLGLEVVQPNQQIICSKSFGHRITALSLIEEAVANYAARACERLRSQHLIAGGLQVFLMTGYQDARPYSNALTQAFPSPGSDSRLVIRLAKWLLRRIYRPGYPYLKAGVMLLDLTSARQPAQGDLFLPNRDNPKLMAALDGINRIMGRDQLFFAAQGTQRPWKMRMAHRSPRYTTDWRELPRVF